MIKMIVYCTCTIFLIMIYGEMIKSLPVPIELATIIVKNDPIMVQIEKDLNKLGVSQKKLSELSNAVYIAHQATGINPRLIIALIYTESNFNETAVGPKNRTKIRYKGLMQTPTVSGFADADILHGARILEQKLQLTQYNVQKALALYKGGNNNVGRYQAAKVIKLYEQLKEESG